MAVTITDINNGDAGLSARTIINNNFDNLNEAVLPTGGTISQKLVKASATNYDVAWADDPLPTLITGIMTDSTTSYVNVGDITTDLVLFIKYSAVRGSLIEAGTLVFTNQVNTYTARQKRSVDSVGATFLKNISGNTIRISLEDTLTNGTDTNFTFIIEKISL